MKTKIDSIINNIVSTHGSSESSEVYTITDIKTGETEIVISKTFTERYSIKEYPKVMELYEGLNRGGGRKGHTLKEFTK